jgi:hypothetical protein
MTGNKRHPACDSDPHALNATGMSAPGVTESSATPRFHVIGELDKLRSLEEPHHALFAAAAAPHIATSFPYMIADAATGPEEQPWLLFAAFRGNNLAGCLYGRELRRKLPGMQIPFFHLGPHCVADPLLAAEDEIDTLRVLLARLLENRRHCIAFRFPRLSAAGFEQMTRALSELGLPYRWHWSSYGYAFDMTKGLDAFLGGMDGKPRRELNRRGRRLGRDHAAEFRRESGLSLKDDLERFETFLGLEDSGWKGDAGTSIRRRQGYEPYFRELIASASRGGIPIWFTVLADGRPIAMCLALRTHDSLWLAKIAYDELYAEHAPGLLLMHYILTESAADDRIGQVENISGAPWVRIWRPRLVPFRSLTLFSRSAVSTCVYRALEAGQFASRIIRRGPMSPKPDDTAFV